MTRLICLRSMALNILCKSGRSIATMFYEDGVPLQSVRDYLGHDYEEMTQQYVDYMPKRISRANQELFAKEGSSLASGIKRCKRGK